MPVSPRGFPGRPPISTLFLLPAREEALETTQRRSCRRSARRSMVSDSNNPVTDSENSATQVKRQQPHNNKLRNYVKKINHVMSTDIWPTLQKDLVIIYKFPYYHSTQTIYQVRSMHTL